MYYGKLMDKETADILNIQASSFPLFYNDFFEPINEEEYKKLFKMFEEEEYKIRIKEIGVKEKPVRKIHEKNTIIRLDNDDE